MANDVNLGVGFVGNEAGLAEFFRSSLGQTENYVAQMKRLFASMAASSQGIAPSLAALPSTKGIEGAVSPTYGAYIKDVKTQLDQYNNVLKTTTTSSIRMADGTDLMVSKLTRYNGSVKEHVALLGQQTEAQARLSTLQKEQLASQTPLAEQLSALPGTIRTQTQVLTEQIGVVEKLKAGDLSSTSARGKLGAETQRLSRYYGQLSDSVKNYSDILQKVPGLDKIVGKDYSGPIIRERLKLEQATAALEANAAAPPTSMPKNLQTLQNLSPKLYQQLVQAGMPTDTASQQAFTKIQAPVKDLTTGLTKLQGEWLGTNNVANKFVANLDSHGKIITKFGGTMSGLSNMLGQTARDFQKVIEWTVATTLVIGTLGLAFTKIGEIVTLDKTLRQFSLTAQMSMTDARSYFGTIVDVANKTATPLQEMLSAMDDIALATKKDSQSMDAWKKSISDVALAVGILTNIANMTTVDATDSLTAIMKQLGLASDQLVAIENKIAAVAGGQSNAIADITKGLSVMAEAGKQAGMTIDEQIGAIQTLSQVTSKTPDEVATSFKNLVGSIDSVGSVKALQKFGIAVHDSAGNIRPFLDIYREIKKAMDTGVIPAGQEKEVVKAISGGPRRAPDAAALLNVIDQVDSAAMKSENATNEALLANARIMDSTSAKLVQFQNTVTSTVFNNFGKGVSDLAAQILPLLTSIVLGIGVVGEAFISSFAAPLKVISGLVMSLGESIKLVVPLFAAFGPIIKILMNLGATLLIFKGVGMAMAALRPIGASLAGDVSKLATTFGLNAKQVSADTTAIAANTRTKLENDAATNKSIATNLKAKLSGAFSPTGALGGKTGVALGAGVGVAAVAGSMAATAGGIGGFNADTGTMLTGLGAMSIMADAVIPGMAGLGIVLLGVGTAMTLLSSDTKAASEDLYTLEQQALTGVQGIQQYRNQLDDLTNTQKTNKDTMDRLSGSQDLTTQETQQLADAQKAYYLGALDIVNINNQLDKSYLDLATTIQKLDTTGKFPNIVAQLRALSTGLSTPEETKTLIYTLANQLYPKQFPTIDTSSATNPLIYDPTVTKSMISSAGISQKDLDRYTRLGIDLTNREDFVNRLVGNENNYTAGNSYLDKTPAATALQNASVDERRRAAANAEYDSIMDKVKATKEYIAQLKLNTIQGIQDWETKQGELAGLYQSAYGATGPGGINIEQSRRNALAASSLMQATEGNKNLSPAEKLINESKIMGTFGTDSTTGLPTDIKLTDEMKKALIEAATGMIIPLEDVAAAWKKIDGSEAKALEDALANAEAVGKIDDAAKAASKSWASKAEAAQAAIYAGQDVEGNKAKLVLYAEMAKDYDILYDKQTKLTEAYGAGSAILSDMSNTWVEGLSTVNGLQDIQGMTLSEITDKVLTLGEAYGLNAEQMAKLTEDLISLQYTAEALAKLKISMGLSLDVDTTAAIGTLQALAGAAYAAGDITTGDKIQAEVDALRAAAAATATSTAAIKADLAGGHRGGGGGGGGSGSNGSVGTIDIPDAIAKSGNQAAIIQEAIKRAKALQLSIPGWDAGAKNDIVDLLNGTKKAFETRGIKEEALQKALNELADIEQKRLDFETKADIIRRIRVGSGDFSAIANVPINSTTGVSVGANNSINVTLNINGATLTPAEFAALADKIGSSIKRQLSS